MVFEGATDDAFETTLSFTDPTADRTWTLPDGGGGVMLDQTMLIHLQVKLYNSYNYKCCY